MLNVLQTEQVERNHIKEKKAAVKEFDDKKVELKENRIAELEEKKKMIENEKLTMELTGGEKEENRDRIETCKQRGIFFASRDVHFGYFS